MHQAWQINFIIDWNVLGIHLGAHQRFQIDFNTKCVEWRGLGLKGGINF
jgi:hypothetical protein